MHCGDGTPRSVCSLCELQKRARSSDKRRETGIERWNLSFDSHQALSSGTQAQHVTDGSARNEAAFLCGSLLDAGLSTGDQQHYLRSSRYIRDTVTFTAFIHVSLSWDADALKAAVCVRKIGSHPQLTLFQSTGIKYDPWQKAHMQTFFFKKQNIQEISLVLPGYWFAPKLFKQVILIKGLHWCACKQRLISAEERPLDFWSASDSRFLRCVRMSRSQTLIHQEIRERFRLCLCLHAQLSRPSRRVGGQKSSSLLWYRGAVTREAALGSLSPRPSGRLTAPWTCLNICSSIGYCAPVTPMTARFTSRREISCFRWMCGYEFINEFCLNM